MHLLSCVAMGVTKSAVLGQIKCLYGYTTSWEVDVPQLYIPTVFWGNTAAQTLTRNNMVFSDEIPFPVDLVNHSFYTPSYLSTILIPALDSLD